MKKKIKDMTFEEFDEWANMRACDGAWSMIDAIASSRVCSEVFKVKGFFNKRRKREQRWKELREEYLNPEAEIEIGE